MQIKRVINLYNKKDATKRSDTNFDPAYNFGFIYKAIVHNANAIEKSSDLEQSGYDTTWRHGCFGAKGSGLTGCITGKSGISKGGQIVITSNVSRI